MRELTSCCEGGLPGIQPARARALADMRKNLAELNRELYTDRMTALVSTRMKASTVAKIDAVAINRSRWLEEAAEEKLARDRLAAGKRKQSAWAVLKGFQGAELKTRRISGKVNKVVL